MLKLCETINITCLWDIESSRFLNMVQSPWLGYKDKFTCCGLEPVLVAFLPDLKWRRRSAEAAVAMRSSGGRGDFGGGPDCELTVILGRGLDGGQCLVVEEISGELLLLPLPPAKQSSSTWNQNFPWPTTLSSLHPKSKKNCCVSSAWVKSVDKALVDKSNFHSVCCRCRFSKTV